MRQPANPGKPVDMRWLIVLLAFVVVVAGALFAAPRLIDQDTQRPFVEAELARLAGTPVQVRGAVDIRLLPRPRAHLRQVVAPEHGIAVNDVSFDLDIAALLRGHVLGRSVRLEGVRAPGAAPTLPPMLPDGVRRLDVADAEWPLGARRVRINTASITRAADGALAVEGRGRIDARVLSVTANVSAAVLGEPQRLTVTLTGDGEHRLNFAGMRQGGDTPRLNGRVAARGRDLGVLLDRAVLDGLGWSLGAEAEIGLGFVALNDAMFTLGDASATGAVSWDGAARRLNAVVQMPRLDLDRLVAAVGTPDLAALLPPDGVTAHVEADVALATLAGGIIQQMRLEADAADGSLQIERMAALLPGGADMSLTGRLEREDGKPAYTGRFEGVADNARALFDWAGVKLEGLPADRLRRVQFGTGVRLTEAVAELTDMDLQFDGTKVAGVAALALRARPSFSIDLRADHLNLDAYLPALLAVRTPLAALTRFDTNARLAVGQLSLAGEPFADVDAALALLGGKLRLDRLAADVGGGALALAGDAVIAPSGTSVWDLRVKGEGDDFARFLRAFAINPLVAVGPAFGLDATLRAESEGLTLAPFALALGSETLTGRLSLPFTTPDVQLELTGDGAGALAGLLGGADLPAALATMDMRLTGAGGDTGRWQGADRRLNPLP